MFGFFELVRNLRARRWIEEEEGGEEDEGDWWELGDNTAGMDFGNLRG